MNEKNKSLLFKPFMKVCKNKENENNFDSFYLLLFNVSVVHATIIIRNK